MMKMSSTWRVSQLYPVRTYFPQRSDASTLGTLFEAGADTTTSTLISLFLACALDPEVCKKIQAEVDSYTTAARMPTMEDARQMTYIEAVSQELLVRVFMLCRSA